MIKRIIIILFLIGLFIAIKEDFLNPQPTVVKYTGHSEAVQVGINEEQKMAQNSAEVKEVYPPQTDPRDNIEIIDKHYAIYIPTPKDLGIIK